VSVLFNYYQCQLQFALGSLCTPNQFMSSSRNFKQMYIFCALMYSWTFMCSNISIEMCRLVEYVPLGPCVSSSILGTILDLLQKIPPQVPKLFIPFLVAVCLNQLVDFFNKKLQSFRNLFGCSTSSCWLAGKQTVGDRNQQHYSGGSWVNEAPTCFWCPSYCTHIEPHRYETGSCLMATRSSKLLLHIGFVHISYGFVCW
jgi:hypothetical protein